MRSRPAFAVLCLLASAATAQIQYVQSKANYSFSPALQLPFAQPVGAGNTVIAAVISTPPEAIVSVTDEQGHPMVLDYDLRNHTGGAPERVWLFHLLVLDAGVSTLNYAVTGGGTYVEGFQLEYSGIDPVAPFDSAAGNMKPNSNQPWCGPLVSHAPQELLVNWVVGGGSMITGDPGWNERMNFNGDLLEDRLGPPGSYAASVSMNSMVSTSLIGGYFPAGAGSAPAAQLRPLQVVSGSTAQHLELPFGHPVQPGTSIVIAVEWYPALAPFIVTDNLGRTPTPLTVRTGVVSSTGVYLLPAAAGLTSLTYEVDGGASVGAVQLEYPGLDTTNPVEATSEGGDELAASWSVPALTTSAPVLLFNWMISRAHVTAGDPAFATRAYFANDLIQDRLTTAAGTFSPSAAGNDAGWAAHLVAFRLAAHDGGTGSTDSGSSDGGTADAGSPDAGSTDADGGAPGQLKLRVGCSASPAAGFALFALALLLARRRAR